MLIDNEVVEVSVVYPIFQYHKRVFLAVIVMFLDRTTLEYWFRTNKQGEVDKKKLVYNAKINTLLILQVIIIPLTAPFLNSCSTLHWETVASLAKYDLRLTPLKRFVSKTKSFVLIRTYYGYI
jgi:hypothetical protein